MYIISAERRPNRDMLFERQAVLHSLHRAILTSPTPLPDTVFAVSIIDSPRQNAWSFSRSNDPKVQGNYWLMPHFSFWSWPKRFIGTVDEALSKIAVVEKELGWHGKIEKAVWRGTVWFNSLGNTQLRPKLIEATKGRDWADVQDMKWVMNGVDAENAISIEDFCKYKYIIYTEVRSFDQFFSRGQELIWYFEKGSHIFWTASFPPSMQISNPHSASNISDAHNPPNATPLLPFSTLQSLLYLLLTTLPKSAMAHLVHTRKREYHICTAGLE